MSDTPRESSQSHAGERRVHPRVAVAILETIRSQDLPTEIMESEDPSVTMPRRLGLSDVVERQIERYQEDVRRRHRLTDDELRDLIQLAIRRPDAEDIFFLAGEALAGSERASLGRLLPRRLGYMLARRRVRRRLQRLFGRSLGGFGRGVFTFEGRSLPFIRSDPGGDACAIVSGLCQAVVSRHVRVEPLVIHVACQSRGDDLCQWKVTGEGAARRPRSERIRAESAEAVR